MQVKNIINLLDNPKVIEFIGKFGQSEPSSLALKFNGKVDFDLPTVLTLIRLYQKASQKLPFFCRKKCALTQKGYEQSTSEIVAKFKASLFHGKSILNLSGGLGVDDWAFSSVFENVVSVDLDKDLNEIVRYNIKQLGMENMERITADAYEYLPESGKFDYIYIDPDRRATEGKIVSLSESEPDYFKLLPELPKHASRVIIKASPLIDIKHSALNLKHLEHIYVIAHQNEVKEVLFLVNFNHTGPAKKTAVNIISEDNVQKFSPEFPKTGTPDYRAEGKYFYEPNLAIIKAGLVKEYGICKSLNFIAPLTSYLLSEGLVEGHQGRAFKISEVLPYKPEKIKAYLKKKGITKANIARRNFRLKVEELRRTFRLNDGGVDYFFFTSSHDGSQLMYHCLPL